MKYLCTTIAIMHSMVFVIVLFMRILSFSKDDQQAEQVGTFVQSFDCQACHISFQGDDGFNMFFGSLMKDDTIVVVSLNGIFAHVESFLMFLRFCKSQSIRLISIDDEIDSADEIFPLSSSTQLLNILSSLKASKGEETIIDAESEWICESKRERMLKRHRMVINLYTANYSVKDIMRLTGYKSNKNIYLILQRYGIGIEYPSMRRGKTKDSHLHTDSRCASGCL